MKKITLLLTLLTISFGYSQTLDGTWKMSPIAGSFGVGPGKGDTSWYANNVADLTTRACYFDDDYVFNANGTFSNVQGAQTWLEGWQGPEGCNAPVAPHNGSNAATWSYDAIAKTLTLTGVGAYIGLPKVYNGGELPTGVPPASITYLVTAISASSMTLDIAIGAPGYWRFILSKQGVAPSCTDGIKNGDETGVDCGGSCPNACLAQINLPVNFEGTGVDYTVIGFGDTVNTLVVDPTDAGNKVIQTIKTAASPDWAGTTIGNPSFSSLIPLTAVNTKMYVKVWAPAAGTPVLLKVEVAGNPTQSCETLATTSVAAGWQIMEFNFANERPGTAALNPSFKFNMASIFFNFGTSGATSGEQTYYFDDVSFGTPLSTSSFENAKVRMFPNPAKNSLTINAQDSIENVSLYTVLGQKVIDKSPKLQNVTLDLSGLQRGVYVVKTTINGKVATSKVIKE